jgi:hypothetical protein
MLYREKSGNPDRDASSVSFQPQFFHGMFLEICIYSKRGDRFAKSSAESFLFPMIKFQLQDANQKINVPEKFLAKTIMSKSHSIIGKALLIGTYGT